MANPTSNDQNQVDWCSERYGFVTVPKDGSRDFRKLSDGAWCSWVEAQTMIERLTRERDEAARLYGTKEALDALRDRKTLESERAAWEKRAMEAEADWRRVRAALDNLVGAVGALSDPEDQLICIPAGPEAEELWHAWKAGETALSGDPTSAVETSGRPKDGPGSILGCTCMMCEYHRSAEAIERQRRSEKASGNCPHDRPLGAPCPRCDLKAAAYPHNPPDGCLDCLRVERSAH